MIPTSPLYKQLLSEEHSIETRLVIGTSGVLITEDKEGIVFGNDFIGTPVRILVEQGGAEDGFTEEIIFSLSTHHALFDGQTPLPGCTVAGEIDVEMLYGNYVLPRMAQLIPYIRLVSADGTRHSEWLQKGVYFIDTREITHNNDGLDILKIHGYDALLKAQADYPSDNHTYPATDVTIAKVIAKGLGLDASGDGSNGIDERTWDVMTGNYEYGLPVGYSMQEVLSSIAMPYVGCWVMTDLGKLRLISLTDLPKETRLLTDEIGYVIIFGTEGDDDPVRIMV